jgi:hypothetical protein
MYGDQIPSPSTLPKGVAGDGIHTVGVDVKTGSGEGVVLNVVCGSGEEV